MTSPYFSDRELGPRPRINGDVSPGAWGGIVAAVESRITDGSLGHHYPARCEDGLGCYGCDRDSFRLAVQSEIPDLTWPLDPDQLPQTLVVLDLVEFCYRAVGKPIPGSLHKFFGHTHLSFHAQAGQTAFRQDINRILARNQLVYELDAEGQVVRLAPLILREVLVSSVFRTGDPELDSLLHDARAKYLDPDPRIRRESLEKLWDAWERLKTLEPGKDKKASIASLLGRAAVEPSFRATLDSEASELTRIGNAFLIRHAEKSQVRLEMDEHVDYLFHRLFALIRLLLRTTGRGG
ncbi:MAG: hypothetical protein HY690_16505 [Chloroflexi bacterium]|nr:hypothetical protein [Chloroflexota bacterium]